MQHSQLYAPNFDLSEKELISKENIIKHPLISNLSTFIYIYFLRDAYVSTFLKLAPSGRHLREVEFR